MAADPNLGGQTILVVLAHPDDESLACGGTLARLADAGAHIVLLCASQGERGSLTGPARNDTLLEVRTLELRNASTILGIGTVLAFNHPDGDLRWADVTDLHAEIALTIQRFKPHAVITFGEDGLYWHLDHVGVHERTTSAVKSFGPSAPPLYYVTMPPGSMAAIVDRALARGWTQPPKGFWSLAPKAFGLAAEPPTVIVDAGDWALRKLDAIRCHRSQSLPGDPFSDLDEAHVRRWLGLEYFHRAPIEGTGETVLEALGSPVVHNHR
jgi:LmbE family N-acetylglucosaminyl deacetylase